MRTIKAIILVSIALLVASCATVPSGPRSINLGEESYSEANFGKFTSWFCRDYIDETRILLEVGRFNDSSLNGTGFVLYSRSSGQKTNYRRKGVNLRWDWGPNDTDYAFVLKPDGIGLYYDFSNANEESVKADQVYRCSIS